NNKQHNTDTLVRWNWCVCDAPSWRFGQRAHGEQQRDGEHRVPAVRHAPTQLPMLTTHTHDAITQHDPHAPPQFILWRCVVDRVSSTCSPTLAAAAMTMPSVMDSCCSVTN